MVEVNIYYQEHRERIEIDMIKGQKWSVNNGALDFELLLSGYLFQRKTM